MNPNQDDLGALKARISKAEAEAQAPEKAAEKEDSSRSVVAQMMHIGSDFIATILTAILIGWALDRAMGWQPWGMLAFLFLGFCGALFRLARFFGPDQVNKSDPSD